MQATPLLPGSEQLTLLKTAQADANGNATFAFDRPPPNLWWTGTLNCAGAPSGSVFSANVDATPWGQWGGNTVYGPVQVQGTQQLKVTVTGLVPSAQYALAWIGSSDQAGTVQPIAPDANATALTAQTTTQGIVDLIGSGTVALVANTPLLIPASGSLTALHSYTSLLVFLDNATNASAPNVFVGAYNIHGGIIVPYESQNSPFEVRPFVADPVVEFLLPFASAAGDGIQVAVTSPISLATVKYQIFGLTAPLAVSVTNPLGNPIDVSERGGASKNSVAVNNNTTVTVLGAAAAGVSYRLHRWGVAAGQGLAAMSQVLTFLGDGAGTLDTQFIGLPASTTFFGAGWPLFGQLSTGPVNLFQLNGAGGNSLTLWVTYDVIPTPVIS